MVSGMWYIVYRVWLKVNCIECTAYTLCFMVKAIWYMVYEIWHMYAHKDAKNHGFWNPPCLGPKNQTVASLGQAGSVAPYELRSISLVSPNDMDPASIHQEITPGMRIENSCHEKNMSIRSMALLSLSFMVPHMRPG